MNRHPASRPDSRLLELMNAIWCICPGASFGEDNSGQLIIYTDHRVVRNGQLEDGDDELIPLDL